MFYFALFDDGLTLKTLKLVYIGFCIQTLQTEFYAGPSNHPEHKLKIEVLDQKMREASS